jgi:hypothetical protein
MHACVLADCLGKRYPGKKNGQIREGVGVVDSKGGLTGSSPDSELSEWHQSHRSASHTLSLAYKPIGASNESPPVELMVPSCL